MKNSTKHCHGETALHFENITSKAKQNEKCWNKKIVTQAIKKFFQNPFHVGCRRRWLRDKRTATSSPVMCLQISVAYPSQPRISPHWFRCILHTACTLFLGADLKYNSPPYLRKLTRLEYIYIYTCTRVVNKEDIDIDCFFSPPGSLDNVTTSAISFHAATKVSQIEYSVFLGIVWILLPIIYIYIFIYT